MFYSFSFTGGESIERGDSTGGKPLPSHQLHVRGKHFVKAVNLSRNILAISWCHNDCFMSQNWIEQSLATLQGALRVYKISAAFFQVTCPLTPTLTINLPSPSSKDHWDANTAGGRGDEGLRVLWSAREEKGYQVSMLSQANQLLARWITFLPPGSSYYNTVS